MRSHKLILIAYITLGVIIQYIYELQSAGMVCFYTISRGMHLFSESTVTPDDIMKGNYDLSFVEDLVAFLSSGGTNAGS